jgi:hypothetical protein
MHEMICRFFGQLACFLVLFSVIVVAQRQSVVQADITPIPMDELNPHLTGC